MINTYEDLGPFVKLTVGDDHVKVELLFMDGNTITYDYLQYRDINGMKSSMVCDLFYFMVVAGIDNANVRRLIHEKLLDVFRENDIRLSQCFNKFHNRA